VIHIVAVTILMLVLMGLVDARAAAACGVVARVSGVAVEDGRAFMERIGRIRASRGRFAPRAPGLLRRAELWSTAFSLLSRNQATGSSVIRAISDGGAAGIWAAAIMRPLPCIAPAVAVAAAPPDVR